MIHPYSGFWLRVAAALVDLIFIIFILTNIKDYIPVQVHLYLVNILFSWIYFATFHSSKWKATIGKKLVGIEVLDYDRKQINFKQASIRYFTSFISAILILPYLTIIFTKKKQALHDMLAKTIVVDLSTSKGNTFENEKQSNMPEKVSLRRKVTYLLLTLFIGVVIYILYPIIVLVVVYGIMGMNNTMAYNKSFETIYTVKDYNDSRINFYMKELDKSSKGFVSAQGLVDIFEYDVKVDLSTACIEYYLKDHNETDWINVGSGIRRNARNRFAINEDLIQRVKTNEKSMGKNFYLYDLNLVNEKIDDITNLWHDKSKKSKCDQNLSVTQLYEVFLTNYLKDYIEQFLSSQQSNQSSASAINHFEKHKQEENSWLVQITKKSSLEIYKQYTKRKITLADVGKYNTFVDSLSTFDIAFGNNEFIIADSKRGIELWKKDSKGTLVFKKTLSDVYQVSRIKRNKNLLFAIGHKKNKYSHFITYKYDEKTKNIQELDSLKISNHSRVTEWKFFDNYTKVAITQGYDLLMVLDVSNPNDIEVIMNSKNKVLPYANTSSRDLALNEKTNMLYELRRRALIIFNIKDNKVFRERIDYSFKEHENLLIDEEENTLYTLQMTWKNGSFLHKYSLKNPSKPEEILSKHIDIVRSSYWVDMQMHNDKIFIKYANIIYIFDKSFNYIDQIETPGIINFYFFQGKIVYTRRENGLVFLNKKY